LRMVAAARRGVLLMTNRFKPTGGVISPNSMLMVRMTPNQIGSKLWRGDHR
jgi:hypothetical protein